MQKMRKMARAIFKVERNTLEVRLLLDSRKPIHNHRLEFAFKNVRHALNGGSIPALSGARQKHYRFAHSVLPRSILRFTDLVDRCREESRFQHLAKDLAVI